MGRRVHHEDADRVRRLVVTMTDHSYREVVGSHCVVGALARAAADDPDELFDVAERFHLIREELLQAFPTDRDEARTAWQRTGDWPGCFLPRGSWIGCITKACEALGIPFSDKLEEEPEGPRVETCESEVWGITRYRRRGRNRFPTMAQWERRHPEVEAAIIHGTRHAGYFERDEDGTAHVYNMGARKRVDYAIVLR